jgi:hydrocephalus-inducing protein
MIVKPGGAQASAKPPAAQLFDILPIKGLLRPGETETVNFSFFAFPGVKAAASAICLVEGGPSYTVSMSGESNYIKYSVEPQRIDMGTVPYSKMVEQALVITNNGKVPYDFNIDTSQLSRPSIVEPSPRKGVVGPGLKTTIKLKVRRVLQ